MKTLSEVIVYHDEARMVRSNLKAHIFLFVPQRLKIVCKEPLFENEVSCINSLSAIYKKIIEVRDRFNKSEHKFHFSEISGARWTKHDEAEWELMNVAVDSLRKN